MTREQIMDEVCRRDPAGAEWHRQYAAEHPDEWPQIVTEMNEYYEDPDTGVIDGYKHYRAGWAAIDWR